MQLIQLILRIANRLLRNTRWYSTYWGGVNKFWSINTFGIQAVNLGSNSGLCAFDYTALPITGQNWAVGPQSLHHDYAILRNYFSYLREGATVLITLCPFSCMETKYGKEANLKYYTILHPATIQGFEESERTKALSTRNNPLKMIHVRTLLQLAKGYAKLFIPRRKNFEDSATRYMHMWCKQFGISLLSAPLTAEHQAQQQSRSRVLAEMIEFCLERDLCPVLVIPPVHPALAKLFPPEFIENYINRFVHKANTAQVPYLSYMSHADFTADNLFHDAFLLNRTGARLFTRRVLTDLGLIGAGQ